MPDQEREQPFLTVVIPTCNRLGDVVSCLDSLSPRHQLGVTLLGGAGDHDVLVESLPPPSNSESNEYNIAAYEVIVTDDGVNPTAEETVRSRFPWVRWTEGPRRGPAANRNHGARIASGKWVLFIDDDCLADPSWLQAVARFAIDPEIDVIEGKTIMPDKRDNPFLHGVENESGGCYWSCNLAVRREAFWRIGGFDEDFAVAGGEDLEFAARFQRHGLRAAFVPEGLVLHPQARRSPWKVLRRLFFDMKWYRLFLLKVGQSPPVSTGALRVCFDTVSEHIIRICRQTLGALAVISHPGWKTALFNAVTMWLFMPIQIPYQVWWEFKFRRRIRVGPTDNGRLS